jgi:radical SAM-linked protein
MSDFVPDPPKVARIRLIYEKRGKACFVPHVALSSIFARAARRARLELSYSEGFSPRARISFGPELPSGVVALNEPADLWFLLREDITEDKRLEFLESVAGKLNAQMPDGFLVKKCVMPIEGAPALGKECVAAHYITWTRNGLSAVELLSHMERYYGEALLKGFVEQTELSWVSAVLANPSQNGIGGLIKVLVADRVVGGWHDMCIVRTGLGRWNGVQIEPMEEGCRAL